MERGDDELLRHLVHALMPVNNRSGREVLLAAAIERVVRELGIPVIAADARLPAIDQDDDRAWGMYFCVPVGSNPRTDAGLLLLGHLDATDTPLEPEVLGHDIDRAGRVTCEGSLDDKAGLCAILAGLRLLLDARVEPGLLVHVYFSVREELGQKGAMRFPLERLFGRVRGALAVDRRTGAGQRGQRHWVDSYFDVPLTIDELCPDVFTRAGIALPREGSRNASDLIELRGRWDAEGVLPAIGGHEELARAYRAATEAVLTHPLFPTHDQRVSAMRSSPRIERYRILQRVYAALYDRGAAPVAPEWWLSGANLSLDYGARNEVSLGELGDVAALVAQLAAGLGR